MTRQIGILLIFLLGAAQLFAGQKDNHKRFWHWEDEFNAAEKNKLIEWIEKVDKAAAITLGVYPFDVHFFFHRSQSTYSPVPYGYASRRTGQNEVHFYVNPEASLEELLEDWTAPHEISHLAIPFVGPKSMWFSEGFATFLSRQIMMEMGYYTQEEFDELYLRKIREAKSRNYVGEGQTFIQMSDSLIRNHVYGPMYWGSTSYFMTIDQTMRKKANRRFIDVIKAYQLCCRESDRTLKDVISSFDHITHSSLFSDLMRLYRTEPASVVLESF